MRKYICEGLDAFLKKEPYPWHMPGHKRKGLTEDGMEKAEVCLTERPENSMVAAALAAVERIDVTEVDGTDDLHHPEEMIKKSLEQLREIYGTFSSYYMVNGSTGGILTAVTACMRYQQACGGKRKKILVMDNCHKSVFNAVDIIGAEAIYMKTAYLSEEGVAPHAKGVIDIAGLIDMLEEDDIGVVVITSPTYEGVLEDVGAIAEVVHENGAFLVVDEAHGAQLPFCAELPRSAIRFGADIVVQSIHKTLEGLTQTAVLHVNVSCLDLYVKKYLAVYMSSSPSYVLLASMEMAIYNACNAEFGAYIDRLRRFRDRLCVLRHIVLYTKEMAVANGAYDYDETRLVLIAPDKGSGQRLSQLLQAIGNVRIEMAGTDYVVLISTYKDEDQDFERLFGLLMKIDGMYENLISGNIGSEQENQVDAYDVQEAFDFSYLIGNAAAANIYVYPPGSYIVREGETITEEQVTVMQEYAAAGLRIHGI